MSLEVSIVVCALQDPFTWHAAWDRRRCERVALLWRRFGHVCSWFDQGLIPFLRHARRVSAVDVERPLEEPEVLEKKFFETAQSARI